MFGETPLERWERELATARLRRERELEAWFVWSARNPEPNWERKLLGTEE